jgi:hypothetical protein
MSQPNEEQIDALFQEVVRLDVPEPSPLFWDHFAARVNAAIDAPPPRRWWQAPAVFAWTAAAMVVLASVLGFYVIRPALQGNRAAAGTTQPADRTITGGGDVDAPAPDTVDIERDEAWAVVRSFAEEMQYDEAREAGVLPRPGSVERAATELSAEERAELVRLIQDELKRTGA